MERVTVAGNLVAEPRVFPASGDKPMMVVFSVAEQERLRDENGKWHDGEVRFYDVRCRGRLAENVAASRLARGASVVAVGRRATRDFKDAHGVTQIRQVVNADDVAASMKWVSVAVGEKEASRGDAEVQSERDPFVEDEEEADSSL